MSHYIDELNPAQLAAVTYCDGPSLVIAGAGSGKTRVLTYKIAYLLEHGYEPWSILALTFTNKAAREMKERIAKQVGEDLAKRLWMGTFHSMFLRILRAEVKAIGFEPNFTIYDASDSKNLVHAILKEMGLDEKVYKPSTVLGRISNAKNHLVTPAGYAASKEALAADAAAKIPAVHQVYRRYWERCRQANAMDFDDILLYTFILFRDFPEVLSRYQVRFRYLLVDEYQDTNFAQHSIVVQLAREHQRVCVVGDDAQSIYSFRGADIDNILYFSKLFPDTRLFKLEQNYRSTRTIVSAANSLIKKNRRQIPKDVFSEKPQGDAIEVFQAYSDIEEADMMANKVKALMRERRYAYNDFAVLYRTNAQSRVLEEALRKRALPYQIYGGLSFYQRKEVKDIIAYFRLVSNCNDEEALKRIINYPARGIGATTIGKIVAAASGAHVSLWQVLSSPLEYVVKFNKGTLEKLQNFRDLIEGFIARVSAEDAYTLGTDIVRQTGILAEACPDTSPESMSRKENIEELMNGLNEFCERRREEGAEDITLSAFLSEVSLLTDQDTNQADSGEHITLMTVHAAKGLEFKNVFVVGLEESLFPSGMAGLSALGLEEERRLFYVAITRAEEHCFLSYAKSRYRYGKMEFASPSRFLKDIDAKFLMQPGSRTAPFQKAVNPIVSSRNLKKLPEVPPVHSSVSSFSLSQSQSASAYAGVRVGQFIEHERFGVGKVMAVEGSGDNAKATIEFQNVGKKQLLLRFARFKVIG